MFIARSLAQTLNPDRMIFHLNLQETSNIRISGIQFEIFTASSLDMI